MVRYDVELWMTNVSSGSVVDSCIDSTFDSTSINIVEDVLGAQFVGEDKVNLIL